MQSDPAQSFRHLYADHHGWLRGLLRTKLSCHHQAEDLTQDTFLKVLVSRAAEVLAEPRAFLRVVANGLLVSHWRRVDLERAYLDALQTHSAAQWAASPEERAQAMDALEQIDKLLDGINPKASRAFLMAQLEGMTYSDIGHELGVSERMVKKYMAQVMHQLLLQHG